MSIGLSVLSIELSHFNMLQTQANVCYFRNFYWTNNLNIFVKQMDLIDIYSNLLVHAMKEA